MITMLHVPYTDVRAADLRWSDTAARLPALEFLDVPIAGGGGLELAIVGCSHQVVVDAPWLQLTETVARLEVGGTPLGAEGREVARVGYTFAARVERHDETGFEAELGRLLEELDGAPETLVGRFPGRPGAVTVLRCDRADAGGLAWRTWHTYPGCGEIVTTSTAVRRP